MKRSQTVHTLARRHLGALRRSLMNLHKRLFSARTTRRTTQLATPSNPPPLLSFARSRVARVEEQIERNFLKISQEIAALAAARPPPPVPTSPLPSAPLQPAPRTSAFTPGSCPSLPAGDGGGGLAALRRSFCATAAISTPSRGRQLLPRLPSVGGGVAALEPETVLPLPPATALPSPGTVQTL